jgi:hypothetical protein
MEAGDVVGALHPPGIAGRAQLLDRDVRHGVGVVLGQRVVWRDREPQRLAQRFRRLDRAAQRAGVDGFDPLGRQPGGQRLGLALAEVR